MEEDSPVAIQILEEPDNGRKRITFRSRKKSSEDYSDNQRRSDSKIATQSRSPHTPTINVSSGGIATGSTSPRSPSAATNYSPSTSSSGKKPEDKLKNKMINVWNNMKYGSGFGKFTVIECHEA